MRRRYLDSKESHNEVNPRKERKHGNYGLKGGRKMIAAAPVKNKGREANFSFGTARSGSQKSLQLRSTVEE